MRGMTQEKKQTAVQWLVNELTELEFIEAWSDDILKARFEQALAMEREQIKEAYMDSEAAYHSMDDAKAMAEHYYDKKYGKEATDANG